MSSMDGTSLKGRGCSTPVCKFSGNIYAKFLDDFEENQQQVKEEEVRKVVEYKVPEDVPEWPLDLELTPELEDLCKVFQSAEQSLSLGA